MMSSLPPISILQLSNAFDHTGACLKNCGPPRAYSTSRNSFNKTHCTVAQFTIDSQILPDCPCTVECNAQPLPLPLSVKSAVDAARAADQKQHPLALQQPDENT